MKEKPLFVRVKGKCGVVIIPIEYYLKGLDFENWGIATKFIEEDSKEMENIIWDKDNYLKEVKEVKMKNKNTLKENNRILRRFNSKCHQEHQE